LVLALGMTSTHRKPAPRKADGAPASPRALRYVFWIVIALSAGAIAAATLAFRQTGGCWERQVTESWN
jgi:hypothetical protein